MFIYIYTEYIHICIYSTCICVYIYYLEVNRYTYICYVKFPHINVTVIYWCAGWFVYLLCSYIWLCMCMLIILKSISNFSMFCSILSPLWFSSAWLVSRTLQENMVFIIIATQKADQRVGQTENLREICSNYHPGNTFRFFFSGYPQKKHRFSLPIHFWGKLVMSCPQVGATWSRGAEGGLFLSWDCAGQETVVWTSKKVRVSVYHGNFHGLYIYYYIFRYRYRW
jgi:hypothetical protein